MPGGLARRVIGKALRAGARGGWRCSPVGCRRRAVATRPGREKAPPTVGSAGLNAKGSYILWEKHIHYFFCYTAMRFSRFYGIALVRVFMSFFIKNCRIEKPSMNR